MYLVTQDLNVRWKTSSETALSTATPMETIPITTQEEEHQKTTTEEYHPTETILITPIVSTTIIAEA